jgi:peptidyl-prolyl cis-trans isomerase B (cyclophilin B)
MLKKNMFFPIVSFFVMILSSVVPARSQESPESLLIRIETGMGDMILRLYDQTPVHRDNMIKLIREGYYDRQLFHRVIRDFMIQGGDPHSKNAEKGQRLGTGGPGYTLPPDIHNGLIHKKGALAAARKGDQVNPGRRSSGSQFYIVQGRVFTRDELQLMVLRNMHGPFTDEAVKIYTTIGGAPHLDGSYTVFGEVVEGMDVLDSIARVETDSYNRPLEDVVYSISLVK